jgi:hypothetical protein
MRKRKFKGQLSIGGLFALLALFAPSAQADLPVEQCPDGKVQFIGDVEGAAEGYLTVPLGEPLRLPIALTTLESAELAEAVVLRVRREDGTTLEGAITKDGIEAEFDEIVWTPAAALEPGSYRFGLTILPGWACDEVSPYAPYDLYANPGPTDAGVILDFVVLEQTLAEVIDAVEANPLPFIDDIRWVAAECCSVADCSDGNCVQCWEHVATATAGFEWSLPGMYYAGLDVRPSSGPAPWILGRQKGGTETQLFWASGAFCADIAVGPRSGPSARTLVFCEDRDPEPSELGEGVPPLGDRERVPAETCAGAEVTPGRAYYVVRAPDEPTARSLLRGEDDDAGETPESAPATGTQGGGGACQWSPSSRPGAGAAVSLAGLLLALRLARRRAQGE